MAVDTGLPYTFSDPLRTDRLILRQMTMDDVDQIHTYHSRPDVCRYLPFEPRSRDEVVERVAKNLSATKLEHDHDYLQLALELRTGEDTGRVIGDSYFSLASVENATGEIGWCMHHDFMGRGYAAEAARAVLQLAFETISLHRVYAELDVRNDASVALCRRLGMREEAHFVQDMMFKGEWTDTGIYAILGQEWRTRRMSVD